MRNIALVTGVDGFIGSHAVEFLRRKGWDVIGSHLADPQIVPSKKEADGKGTVRFVQCDLRNGQRVTQILTEFQPTHVFHMAAQSLPTLSWADPVRTFESNIMGSLYLFEAVRHLKRRPVVVSACSSAEYGYVPQSALPTKEERPLNPLHPYGISKVCLDLVAREYFRDYKVPIVNIRLFNTTGPGKRDDAPSDFVRQLVAVRKGQQAPVIEVGNLKPHRAFLDVHDSVRGFYLAATKGKLGEAYNLCAARTYQISEVLHAAIRISGVKVKVEPSKRLMRPSDEKVIFGSTQKIRRDTGWKPLISLEQTLKSMFEHWSTQA